MGPARSHKPSALGKAGLKPAQSLGHRGITRWSCSTSAHKRFQSTSGFQVRPPVPLLTLPCHRPNYPVPLPTPRKVGGQEQGAQVLLRLHLCINAWETQAARPSARRGRVHGQTAAADADQRQVAAGAESQGSLLLCLVRGCIVAISITPQI